MILQEFLRTFLSSYPQSRLVVLTKHNRDYFINVVPLLFHIDIIVNNRNQFSEPVVIDYENDISINMEDDITEPLTKTQFSVIDGEVKEFERSKVKIDIKLPLDFFRFLTT